MSSSLVKTVQRALAIEAAAETQFVLRVGVLAAMDYSRAEIAEKLDASPTQVRAAIERLKRASEHIEGGLPGLN